MHYIDVDSAYREKARLELYKNAKSYIEQILDAIPHKTSAVRSPTSHLKNHRSKKNKTHGKQLEK